MTPEQTKAKQQAEVMLAFAEGEEIEWRRKGYENWQHGEPQFNWAEYHYRVKPDAPKKIKFEAWLSVTGELRHYPSTHQHDFAMNNWKRLPLLDLETEVTE